MDCREASLFGTVVKSACGRDRKRVFIVIGEENGLLLVTDGCLRPAASPKGKNPRHVKLVGHMTEAECGELAGSLTDTTVRRILGRYDSKICNTEQN